MKYLLALTVLPLLFLNSCLEDETPCTYNRPSIAILTSGEWNVDTFHVFIYDSVSLYQRDTTYINDGTMRFNSEELDCSEGYYFPDGTISFDRSDGQSYLMNYSVSNYGPYADDFIRINSAESLDGFAEPYDIKLWWRFSKDKMTITFSPRIGSGPPYIYNNRNLKYVRYWEFVMSRN